MHRAVKMSKLRFLSMILPITLVSVAVCLGLLSIVKNIGPAGNKYILLNENIVHNDKLYIPQGSNVIAVNLAKQIGVTDLKQQVYKIAGQDESEWICLRHDGNEIIFKEKATKGIAANGINPNVIILKSPNDIGASQTTITDKAIISSIVSKLTTENLTAANLNINSAKKVMFFTAENPGICVILHHMLDEEGNNYLVEMETGNTWQIGDELNI